MGPQVALAGDLGRPQATLIPSVGLAELLLELGSTTAFCASAPFGKLV